MAYQHKMKRTHSISFNYLHKWIETFDTSNVVAYVMPYTKYCCLHVLCVRSILSFPLFKQFYRLFCAPCVFKSFIQFFRPAEKFSISFCWHTLTRKNIVKHRERKREQETPKTSKTSCTMREIIVDVIYSFAVFSIIVKSGNHIFSLSLEIDVQVRTHGRVDY